MTKPAVTCCSALFASAKLVGDPTTLMIVKILLNGEKRYKEIKSEIASVCDVTLTDRLKKLKRHGLVIRTQHQEIPPRVTYSLTKQGNLLKPVIKALEIFGENYS